MTIKLESELRHLSSLFNRKVYKNITGILDDFPWNTEVAKKLFEAKISLYEMDVLTVQSLLTESLIPEELENFCQLIEEYRDIKSQKEVDAISEAIFSFYKTRKINDIIQKYSNDIDKVIKEVKRIPESIIKDVEIVNLGSIDPKEIMENDVGNLEEIIPTNFKLIRDATPFQGYLPGQVVMVCASPGTGKSSLMLYEALGAADAGFNVLWLALGDLMKYDFLCRMLTILVQEPLYEVALKPDKYFNDGVRALAERIDLITVPAGRISSKNVLSIVNREDKRYDMVIIDYDSNLKNSQMNENMYLNSEEIYNDATEMARPEDQKSRLVFIASQPKIQYWNELIIPLEGAGESSRKQHVIDIMITMGNAKINKPAGIMHLPKVRRGSVGGKTGYVMNEFGIIEEISMDQLSLMRKY